MKSYKTSIDIGCDGSGNHVCDGEIIPYNVFKSCKVIDINPSPMIIDIYITGTYSFFRLMESVCESFSYIPKSKYLISPINEQSEYNSIQMVRQNPLFLEKVINQTKAICIAALKSLPAVRPGYKYEDGDKIRKIFDMIKIRTPAVLLKAVKQYGCFIKNMTADEKTNEIILAAITRSQCAISYIEKNRQTKEIIRLAFEDKRNGTGGYWSDRNCVCENADCIYEKYINKDLMDQPLYFLGFRNHRIYFSDIPIHFLTPEIKLEAVQRSGNLLGHIPEKDRTPELCKAAVQNIATALEYVPIQTEEICLAAFKKFWHGSQPVGSLQYVKNQTEAICIAAVSVDQYNFKYVRERTPAIYNALKKR